MKNNPMRFVFDFIITLPTFIWFYASLAEAVNLPALFLPTLGIYMGLLLISILAYTVSRILRGWLYVKEDIPADTCLFLGNLLIFIPIILFPSINTGIATITFLALDASIIVVSGFFALALANFDKGDFPIFDSYGLYVNSVLFLVILAIFSIVFLSFSRYSGDDC
jgi:hypothetical protein